MEYAPIRPLGERSPLHYSLRLFGGKHLLLLIENTNGFIVNNDILNSARSLNKKL